MFLLRRTAARAIASAPSAFTVKAAPRSITTITPAFRLRQQRWTAPSFQRRFASDEPVKSEEQAAEESPETFAQTATEAPVEENLTPAQEAAQAEPTNASATIGEEALEAVAEQGARKFERRSGAGNRAEGATPSPTIYVGNLYYEVNADQLQRVFSRFGEIDNVKVIYDNRGMSRGFGYVEFKNTEEAKAAVENLDMQVFEGRNLVVQFHRAKENSKTRDVLGGYTSNPPSKTLFIGNMSFEMSDKDLNDLFRDIRNVMDVRVAIDRRTGQPRGFAHADFIDVASATKAKEVLGEKTVYGRQLRIDFSKPGTQSERGDRGGRDDRAPR